MSAPIPAKEEPRTEIHIGQLLNYLKENPGASLPSVLLATYGRTLVHVSELLDIFYRARIFGYGADQNGLWYLITENEELRIQNHQYNCPGPAVEAAIQAVWDLRNTLGATMIDFTNEFPAQGATTP